MCKTLHQTRKRNARRADAKNLQRLTAFTKQKTQQALWELATAGLAAADGFDQLRAMMDPRRKTQSTETAARRPTRATAGRWSLLCETQNLQKLGAPSLPTASSSVRVGSQAAAEAVRQQAIAQARQLDAAHESAARMLLARYGILFRDLLTRESNAPRWRDLLNILRRLEARGEVRGGRFVALRRLKSATPTQNSEKSALRGSYEFPSFQQRQDAPVYQI